MFKTLEILTHLIFIIIYEVGTIFSYILVRTKLNHRIIDLSKFIQLTNNEAMLKTMCLVTVLLCFSHSLTTIIDSKTDVEKEKFSYHWNL